MSFCGTIEHRRSLEFLTLALHTIALYDPLLHIEDARYEAKQGKKRTARKRRGEQQPVTETGQLTMFPLSNKQREEYVSFAKTLLYFLKTYRQEVTKTMPKDKDGWSFIEATADLDYCGHEFYDFWYSLIKKDEAGFEKQAKMIVGLGEGTVPDDCEPTIKFLSLVNAWALSRHNSQRGGCF